MSVRSVNTRSPYWRWKYTTLIETRGNTSCCTPKVYSQLCTRRMSGAGFRSDRTPKVVLEVGPISLSSTMPSPLVGSPAWAGSQVDVPGMSAQSNQLRVSLEVKELAYCRAQLPVHC